MSDYKMANPIFITTEYVTLGQFLKIADVIPTGGAAKWFLAENTVYVNGESENRRGRKLRPEDTVEIPSFGIFIVKQG